MKKIYKVYVMCHGCLGALSSGYYLPGTYTTKKIASKVCKEYNKNRSDNLTIAWVSDDLSNLIKGS